MPAVRRGDFRKAGRMSEDLIEDLSKLFSHGQQLWLLGAGASFESNLPLVKGLTERVRRKLADAPFPDGKRATMTIGHVIEGLRAEIGVTATIEDMLDHLADHLSMARRSEGKTVMAHVLAPGAAPAELRSEQFQYDELEIVRTQILEVIRDTVRWGYVHSDDPAQIKEGSPQTPILRIDHHEKFIDVLLTEMRAGRELRVPPIEFFTTNYDTLIEDALALKGVPYCDGFRGGAVAYWNGAMNDAPTARQDEVRATVSKVHGSIDWVRVGERIVRRRISDPYPKGDSELLIYPQALKYDLTQREPFDSLFYSFRTSLNRPAPQVLLVCGYGFGDDHVDEEIELAMKRADSQLTLVAFRERRDGKPAQWQTKGFGERVYTITAHGVWRGSDGPFLEPPAGTVRNWWTFTGMTSFLRNPGGGV